MRQKSLQMLGDRLQDIGRFGGFRGADGGLFLDLTQALRNTMKSVSPRLSEMTETLKKPQQGKRGKLGSSVPDAKDSLICQQVGLSQSAILCLDTIARHLTITNQMTLKDSWLPMLMGTLTDSVELTTSIIDFTQVAMQLGGSPVIFNEEIASELSKLLGSTFLLCSSLCQSVGPKSLSALSVSFCRVDYYLRSQHCI